MRHRVSQMLQMIAVGVLMLGTAEVALAQLNENCTVSVLNRTVRVNPDGSWVLPNIPANFGPVKARATCVKDGVTTFGESDFFTVPVNGAINLPAIILGATTQIPVSLGITPATLSFTAAGQTTQLQVTATYPDGTTKNVTAASTGTNYTTSNPAIATVSANGLVTAVASGTVVIQATNDGTAGMITANVVLTGADTDGDGIPDAIEIQLGLDPKNPVDAQEDFDRDGLTNKAEVAIGTDIRKADTDGDGILDGEEVIAGADGFITNPLLADTDGDGIRDGLEVQTGSDPTNPNSVNLARALSRIDVSPTSFTLTVNTIIGQASRQLAVTGRLLDGFNIDLTSTQRGTNYSSSNLNVCNFGSPDGRVFAGTPGSCTITASNSGFSAAASVIVRTFAPTALSSISIPGYANNVDVNGNFAFVAAGATGLQVVDVSNPQAPSIVGSKDTPGNANDVRIVGNLAYVADGSAGLQIIDISTPTAPVIVGAVDTPGEAQDVMIAGGRAYVADGATGLQIIDVTNPATPRILGSVDTAGTARGVDVSGNLAIVVDDSPSSAVRIVDVTNPASPQIVGNVAIPGEAKDLRVSGTTAYVVAYTGGFQVVDFSSPTNPRIVGGLPGSSPSGFVPRDVELSGQFALAAEQLFPNVVPIVEISNPANPLFRATLDFAPLGDYAGTGIALTQQFVYMTGESFIVTVENGVTGNTRLFIGQYLALEDTAGIPPTVRITAPANGSSVIEGSTLTIKVDATDDIAVAGVNFLVNGQVVFTDTSAPFEYNLLVPVGATSLTLGATAIDLGSNIGTAANVTVAVIPDPLTTATGTVVDRDGNNVAGARVTCLGLSSTSAADGTFSVPGLSTIAGDIRCTASIVSGGLTLTGVSAPVPPVRGGITNVGGIVVVAAGKAIVASRNSASVHILDIPTLSIESTLNLGSDVIDTAVTPNGTTALVTSFSASKVTFMDLTTNPPTVTGSVTTPMAAEDIAIVCTPNCFALVADGGGATTIVSIDIAGKKIASTLALPGTAEGITVTPSGQVLVNDFFGNTIRVISLSSTGILTDTGVSIPSGGSGPINVTISPNGKIALVANNGAGSIGVLQIAANGTVSLIGALSAFASAQSIAFTPDGLHAYVLLAGGQVGVLNIDAANNVTDSGVRISIAGSALSYYGVDQIAVTGGNKVLAHFNGAVFIIDATTNTVIGTIPIPNDGAAGGISVIP